MPMMSTRPIEWFLRVLVAATFAAHALFLLQTKQAWANWLTGLLGIAPQAGDQMLFAILVIELALAIGILVMPIRLLCLAAAFWAALMLAIRPIPFTGQPIILEFIEHSGYWALPLVLLAIRGWPENLKELLE